MYNRLLKYLNDLDILYQNQLFGFQNGHSTDHVIVQLVNQIRESFDKDQYTLQFVIFKPLSYRFEETIGLDVKVSFARRPVSRLIKPGDIPQEL